MSTFDRRMIGLLAILLAGLARPAFCANADLYEPFQTMLDRHLTERTLPCGGLVSWFDYDGALASTETADLMAAQDANLAGFDPEGLTTREAAIAFWTNAYNYFMLQHILTHPQNGEVVASVRDFGNLFQPYRVFGLKRFNVGGTEHSLRGIELDILLGEEYAERGWKDARVHFAVNCASVGCPPLREAVYRPESLDNTLSENTRMALDTSLHLKTDGKTLYLTELFDWYEDDFVEHSGSVRRFIDEYGSESAVTAARQSERTRFIDYDWQLNSPENMARHLQSGC
ncbi:MAG: DUF547 domain-containing protein [Wenzhouxiangella sp.]|jgi:hypothetical protein|nr:DUF547 domain-containing protein [Wenzhouxiangella sp.]